MKSKSVKSARPEPAENPPSSNNLLTVIQLPLSGAFASKSIDLAEKMHQAKPGTHFHLYLFDSAASRLCWVDFMPINPDAVLAFVDIIQNRPKQISVHIHSRICLKDAEVLVWLAGDTRTIRHDAWIQFQELPPREQVRSDYQQFRDSIEGREIPAGLPPFHANYLQIERLVKKRLPAHLLNRRIWAGELAEWNLIIPAPEIKLPAAKSPRVTARKTSESEAVKGKKSDPQKANHEN